MTAAGPRVLLVERVDRTHIRDRVQHIQQPITGIALVGQGLPQHQVRRLPVVVYSAMFPLGMSPRLARFGVIDLIAKGSPPEELLAAVSRAHAVDRGWLPVGAAR